MKKNIFFLVFTCMFFFISSVFSAGCFSTLSPESEEEIISTFVTFKQAPVITRQLDQLKEIVESRIAREKDVFSYFEENYSQHHTEFKEDYAQHQLGQGADNVKLIVQFQQKVRDGNIELLKTHLENFSTLEAEIGISVPRDPGSFTELLHYLFHNLLEFRHNRLQKYYENFKTIYGGVSTDPKDMASQRPIERFLAQVTIDRFAFDGLIIRGLYNMIEDEASLPEKTRLLLSCCSSVKRYLTGETKELPVPGSTSCIKDVQTVRKQYNNFALTQKLSNLQSVRVVPIPREVRKNLEYKEKKRRAQEAREKRKLIREEEEQAIHVQLYELKLRKKAEREQKIGQSSTKRTPQVPRVIDWDTRPPPLPTKTPRYVPTVAPLKAKTKGISDPSRAALPLESGDLAKDFTVTKTTQEPLRIILDERSSCFFRPEEKGKGIKTYEYFESIFKEFGIIYKDTGSSHHTLCYEDPAGNLHKGTIWNYHAGLEKFGPDSIKHLLRFFEKANLIPWRKTSEGDIRHLGSVFVSLCNLPSQISLLIADYHNTGFISLSTLGKETFLDEDDIPENF